SDHWKSPASISARTSSRPRAMASSSSSLSTPTRASMVAWAREPRISWRYIRWSKLTEAVKRATKASVASLKRPPQDLLVSLLMLMLARAGWIALLRTSGRGYYSLSYQGRANRRENESNIRESRSPPQGRRLPVTQPVPGGGPAGGGHYCRIAVYSDRGGQVGSGQLQLAGPGICWPTTVARWRRPSATALFC